MYLTGYNAAAEETEVLLLSTFSKLDENAKGMDLDPTRFSGGWRGWQFECHLQSIYHYPLHLFG